MRIEETNKKVVANEKVNCSEKVNMKVEGKMTVEEREECEVEVERRVRAEGKKKCEVEVEGRLRVEGRVRVEGVGGEGAGRYVVASAPVGAGEVVLVEEPLLQVAKHTNEFDHFVTNLLKYTFKICLLKVKVDKIVLNKNYSS